jgi:putative transposase
MTQLISLEVTPYYHTISRCARRSFLCGEDSLTGKNCKQWVHKRLQALSEVFAIDFCAYAIMSNHYHLVLRVKQAQAKILTKTQVTERRGKLFNLPQIVALFLRGETHVEAEAIIAFRFCA